MHAWLHAAVRCSIVAILACVASAQGPEALYALDLSSFPRLHTLDMQTGAVLKTVQLPPAGVSQTGLAWDGSRLLIKGNTNWLMDRLVKCHPADGATVQLASVGSPWYLNSLEVDPASGAVRVIAWDQFTNTDYFIGTMNPQTGLMTLGPKIVPVGNWTAMAIDSTGATVIARASGQQYYHLDVATGAATLMVSTTILNSICLDLAFDSSDQLWGSFIDGLNGANTGLYHIDLTTFVTTQVVSLSYPYHGLAFGRQTAAQNYCTPKVSSIGCVPTLSADGIASPNARLGFTIRAATLNNGRVGMLLYTANGQAAMPFQGGVLCTAPPLNRSPGGPTGGTPLPTLDCSGSWSIDYNEMIWNKFGNPAAGRFPGPLQTPGTLVQCQWWGRDPGYAPPNNAMLSDGLEFTLSP